MDIDVIEKKPDAAGAKAGGVKMFINGPLDFQLSSTGLRVSGSTNSALALKVFIAKLNALSALLDDEGDDSV